MEDELNRNVGFGRSADDEKRPITLGKMIQKEFYICEGRSIDHL